MSIEKVMAIALAVAAAAGAVGLVQAEEVAAAMTRAEVKAQLAAAHASGELGAWNGEDGGSHHLSRQPFRSTTTREAVAAEAAAARRTHAMAGFEGEGELYAGPDHGERQQAGEPG